MITFFPDTITPSTAAKTSKMKLTEGWMWSTSCISSRNCWQQMKNSFSSQELLCHLITTECELLTISNCSRRKFQSAEAIKFCDHSWSIIWLPVGRRKSWFTNFATLTKLPDMIQLSLAMKNIKSTTTCCWKSLTRRFFKLLKIIANYQLLLYSQCKDHQKHENVTNSTNSHEEVCIENAAAFGSIKAEASNSNPSARAEKLAAKLVDRIAAPAAVGWRKWNSQHFSHRWHSQSRYLRYSSVRLNIESTQNKNQRSN